MSGGTDGAKAPTAGAPDLRSLIERLEAATAGSKELDRQIARHAGWHRVTPAQAKNRHGWWVSPDEWIGRMSDGSPIYDSLHGTELSRDVPDFTTSLDAALTLVSEGWRIQNLSEWDHEDLRSRGPWMAQLIPAGTSGALGISAYCSGAQAPAIALCIAALKARQAASQGGPTGSPDRGVAPGISEGGEEVTDVVERAVTAAMENIADQLGMKTSEFVYCEPKAFVFAGADITQAITAALTSLLEPTQKMIEESQATAMEYGVVANERDIREIISAAIRAALEGRG